MAIILWTSSSPQSAKGQSGFGIGGGTGSGNSGTKSVAETSRASTPNVSVELASGSRRIQVSTSDEDIELTITNAGRLLTVRDHKTGQLIKVDVAQLTLVLGDGGNELSLSDRFSFKRNGQPVVRFVVSPHSQTGSPASRPHPGAVRNPAAARRDVSPLIVREFAGPTKKVPSIAVSPNGQLVAAAGWDGNVWIWDVRTGKLLHQVDSKRTNASQNLSVIFLADNRHLIVGHAAGVNRIDARTGFIASQTGGGGMSGDVLAVSPDGMNFLVGGRGGQVSKWLAAGRSKIVSVNVPMDLVKAIAILPNSDHVVVAGGFYNNSDTPISDKLRVINTTTQEVVFAINDPVRTTRSNLAVSPDGRFLYAKDFEKHGIGQWDWKSGKKLRSYPDAGMPPNTMSITQDGRYLICGSYTGEIRWIETATGRVLGGSKVHEKSIAAVTTHPDGQHLLSSDSNGGVFMSRIPIPAVSKSKVSATSLIPTHELHRLNVERPHYFAEFLPNGQHIISGGFDTTLRLWDAGSGKELRTQKFQGGQGIANSISVAPDGRTAIIVFGQSRKTFRALHWDIANWKQLGELRLGEPQFLSGAISPDGSFALIGDREGKLYRWDLKTHQHRVIDEAGVRNGSSIAIAANLKTAFYSVGYQSRSVRRIDLSSDRETDVVPGSVATRISLSAKGDSLIGLEGKFVTIRDVKSGELNRKWQLPTTGRDFDLSTDGALMVATSGGSVIGWDVETGTKQFVLQGHTGQVNSVSLSADGKRLATSSYDSTIRVWNVPPAND